jgi:hypothetical protein
MYGIRSGSSLQEGSEHQGRWGTSLLFKSNYIWSNTLHPIFQQHRTEAYTTYENVTGIIIRAPNGSLKEKSDRNDAVDAYPHIYFGNLYSTLYKANIGVINVKLSKY